jgi:hypothetical protein
MKSRYVLDVIYGVIGLISAAVAVWQLYLFASFRTLPGEVSTESYHLWLAIGAALVACVCALLFFLRHVNKEEEFHITS